LTNGMSDIFKPVALLTEFFFTFFLDLTLNKHETIPKKTTNGVKPVILKKLVTHSVIFSRKKSMWIFRDSSLAAFKIVRKVNPIRQICCLII